MAHVGRPSALRVYWELTRACDLACRHCRATAQTDRGADELDTATCERVLADLSAVLPRPHVIFTGGDPLKRPDLLHLIRRAREQGLGVSVAPSATAALTPEVVRALKAAGTEAMSLSVDGPDAARHDAVRGIPGCFARTLSAAAGVVESGLPLQVNTLVARETHAGLPAVGGLVSRLGVARWSLFFLVAVGRGRTLTPLTAEECETTLHWLAEGRGGWPMVVTTTEAPHFRRVILERARAAGLPPDVVRRDPAARAFGIRDGNGIMFIAANGDVTPSGFLPLAAGNARHDDVVALYDDHPMFRALRTPAMFHGRCGACRYQTICGGSRARAWAASGDYLAEDPLCAYQPTAAIAGA